VSAQVLFTEENEIIQPLAAEAAEHTRTRRVRLGPPDRRPEDADALRRDGGDESRGEKASRSWRRNRVGLLMKDAGEREREAKPLGLDGRE